MTSFIQDHWLTWLRDTRAAGTFHLCRCFWGCCWWRAWSGRNGAPSSDSSRPDLPDSALHFQSKLAPSLKGQDHTDTTRYSVSLCITQSRLTQDSFQQHIGLHRKSIMWLESTLFVTQKIPNKDVLEETGWLEAMLEHLLESPHQAVLSAE